MLVWGLQRGRCYQCGAQPEPGRNLIVTRAGTRPWRLICAHGCPSYGPGPGLGGRGASPESAAALEAAVELFAMTNPRFVKRQPNRPKRTKGGQYLLTREKYEARRARAVKRQKGSERPRDLIPALHLSQRTFYRYEAARRAGLRTG